MKENANSGLRCDFTKDRKKKQKIKSQEAIDNNNINISAKCISQEQQKNAQ